jgi:hypothetical protein
MPPPEDSMLTLFDDIDRTDDGPAKYAEPSFPYWNRSARKDIALVRAHLEEWFRRYPTEHASDLRARFRSPDDVQHRGAFFELFLHELLLRLGCVAEVHPEVPGTSKRPEFRVTSPGGLEFYLEAKVANDESDEQAGARARVNRVYDAINDLDSPDYWINVEPRGVPASLVPTKKLKAFLIEQVRSLDYDEIARRYQQTGFADLPRWSYEFEGWSAEFFPIPKLRARGQNGIRPMGVQMIPAHWVDPVTPLRTAILGKAKRYGTPDLPFVIAINALGEHVDDVDVDSALFGDESWVIRSVDDAPEFRRVPNGVWTSPEGQYTRVSAVLVFQKLGAWNFPSTKVRLYHHFAASKALGGALTQLPQALVVDNRLELKDGSSLADIFDLRPDWLAGSAD